MGKFVIEPHFRLQEWVAEEKGYFKDEGLDYIFQELVQKTDGMLFKRMELLLDRKAPASALFSGPYYLAEQLGFRKIIDTTFMIATMITGNPDPEDLRKFFRALKRAQRDIDLRPDLYTHYYENEFPLRYHVQMDTRRWGPGV